MVRCLKLLSIVVTPALKHAPQLAFISITGKQTNLVSRREQALLLVVVQ